MKRQKMNKPMWIIAMSFLLVAAGGVENALAQSAPTITIESNLDSPFVLTEESVVLAAQIPADWSGNAEIQWTADGGALNVTSGTEVTWHAPDEAGVYTVVATVHTDDGIATKELSLPVLRNLVVNGTFEQHDENTGMPSNWSLLVNPDSKVEVEHRREQSDAPEGTAYLHVHKNRPHVPGIFGRVEQEITVTPNSTYTLTAKVRVRMEADTSGYVGGGPDWALRIYPPVNTYGEWIDVAMVFTTGEDETVWPLMVLVEYGADHFDVDDIQIVEGDWIN